MRVVIHTVDGNSFAVEDLKPKDLPRLRTFFEDSERQTFWLPIGEAKVTFNKRNVASIEVRSSDSGLVERQGRVATVL